IITTPSPTQSYTLSLHDALPISQISSMPGASLSSMRSRRIRASTDGDPSRKRRGMGSLANRARHPDSAREGWVIGCGGGVNRGRSEEHTSELQSLRHLVCRLLLE